MSKEYTCLGMMSGTSGDGVDASIIYSNGLDSLSILKEKYFEYDDKLFREFHDLKRKVNNQEDLKNFSTLIKKLEKDITIFHAKAVKEISNGFNLDLIGFHGQTLYHNPAEKVSFQLGDGALLCQLTKKKTVFNFRKNDIFNGGEGAPLTPIFHKYLIKSKKIKLPACILNIGGISNLTLVRNMNNNEILSKDVGPGNCLINAWIQALTDKKFDEGGKISDRGKINEIILEQALETHENNFQKKEYISLDTNDFDISFARGLNIEDGAATLTAFSAKIIMSKINNLLKDYDEKIQIIVCGGGRKNLSLIKQLKLYSNKNLSFFNSEEFGLNGDFIESQAFAYLAIRSVLSLPISFPSTTGCSAPCSGGDIINF
jgi:anhydro-N-acetylmuramic acid kinase